MTTQSFANQKSSNVLMSNISVTETDTGTVASFLGGGTPPTVTTEQLGPYQALDFNSFLAGAIGAGSSLSLEFKYDVSSSTPGLGIASLQQAFTFNNISANVTLVIQEKVYDSNNVLVGTTYADLNASGDPSAISYAPGDMLLAKPYGLLHVDVLLVATVAANAASGATITLSDLEQGFGTAAMPQGVPLPGAVSGIAFLDDNANGVQDGKETTLAGIIVQLLDSNGIPISGATTKTDANGAYSFTGLSAGSYAVSFTAPSGDRFSPVGADQNHPDSVVNSTGNTKQFAVTAGNTTTNENAGLYVPATLTTHIYTDANKSGCQDSGEANLAGVTVNLLNGAGTVIATAVTDAGGNVSFTGLIPGNYDISVTTPAGDVVTRPINIGAMLTLTSGQTIAASEGLFIPGALSGHIFLDANANGVQEAGDTNLAGVTVTLLNGAGVATGATAITDANGFYQFNGLIAGSYAVAFTAPSGDKFSQVGTNASAALDSIVNATGKTAAVAVAAGATTINQNAAVYLPATFTTHVYNDANKNNVQDSSEANLAGVTVNLLTGAGVATGQTAITDANGNVSFAGLTPGSYEVAIVTPTGDIVTQHQNVGTPVTLTSGGFPTIPVIEGLFVPKPGISILKTASVSSTTPGTACPPLTYTFVVTNTGTTALTGVSIVDVTNGNPASSVTYTDPNALAAGATWTYTTPAVTVAATKTAAPVIGSGHGFDLGNVLTYGIIAFNPHTFTESSNAAVIGNVGSGAYGALKVTNGGIAGDLETTGALPGSVGCATSCITTGQDTSYGSTGWSANWGSESSGSSNNFSDYNKGSTGSAVWDQFWSQCTTQNVSPLVLNVSEDAWQGNAQFTVSVDGKQVGGTYTATASHATGCSQAFNLGNFSAGAHTVSVNFVNDAYGGTSSTDRNLYVDSISEGGKLNAGGSQLSGGAVCYSVNPGVVAPTSPLMLNMSEDAYQGNAQFTVCVDGQQVGGTYTATSSHGAGQSQAFNLGNYSLGTHAVTVTFLNDLYCGSSSTDRNLYVDSVTSNGASVCGAALCSNGSASFTINSGSVNGDDSADTWGNFFNSSCGTSTSNGSYAGSAYGQIANSASLAADITALGALSAALIKESGTKVSLCSGTTLNASSGTLDASGNEVFTVTGWSANFSVAGDGSHAVVLNIASGVTPTLGSLSLSGGISANQVLINYTGIGTLTQCGGTTNATVLATNAAVNLTNGTVNGHVLGGAAGQDFSIGCGETIEAPPLTSYTLTDVATVTGNSSSGSASAFDSASVIVNPAGSGVAQNCNAPSSCDNLWSDYGQVGKLEFCFNPGTAVHTNAAGCGISAGSCGTGSGPCFITVTDKAGDSTSGCNTYFEGNVVAGEKFYADSATTWDGKAASGCFSTVSNAMLYTHVFASEADYFAGKSAVQECAYDTSGAHGISLGDQVGCVTVAGYVSTGGHGYLVS